MTALDLHRDDGPLASRIVARLEAGRSRRAPHVLAWLASPLLRALEYAFLIILTGAVEPEALPQCFALVAVLALHHYDVVYRLRYADVAPARWVSRFGGGWEGRIAGASILAFAGWLSPALGVIAAALGLAYVAEAVLGWARVARDPSRPSADHAHEADGMIE